MFSNQENNRLEVEHNRCIIKSIKDHITYLDKQLLKVESAIKNVCNNDKTIESKIKNLTSIPGVGLVFAIRAITKVLELVNIDCGKFTSLVGLAPYAKDLGSYKGKRSIFAGKKNYIKFYIWLLLPPLDVI